MKALLLKDWMLLENQKRFFLSIFFISVVLIVLGQGSFAISLATMIASMFTVSTIAYDEYDHGYPFLMSLPFDRKTYVLSKYVFGVVAGLLSGGLVLFFSFLWDRNIEYVLTFGSIICMVLLMLSIYIPLVLKFGSESSRLAIVGLVGFIFVLGMFLNAIGFSIEGLQSWIVMMHPMVLFVVVLVFMVLIYSFSCWMSIRIMKKKEF